MTPKKWLNHTNKLTNTHFHITSPTQQTLDSKSHSVQIRHTHVRIYIKLLTEPQKRKIVIQQNPINLHIKQ